MTLFVIIDIHKPHGYRDNRKPIGIEKHVIQLRYDAVNPASSNTQEKTWEFVNVDRAD